MGPRLELRRREVNPFREHSVKEFLEPLAIAVHRVSEIVNRSLGEVRAKHRAATIELNRRAGSFRGVFHPRFELRAELFETGIDVLFRFWTSDFRFQNNWLALTLTLSPRRGNTLRSLFEIRTRTGFASGWRQFSLSHPMGEGRSEGCAEFFEPCDAGRHRQRVAAQRPRLIDRSRRRQTIHHVTASAKP